MAKQVAELDPTHQLGLSMCVEDVLIVVGGSSLPDFKKQQNRGRSPLYIHNQTRHCNTDGSIKFSASIMCICAPERRSNRSWGPFTSGSKKAENRQNQRHF